MITRLFLSPSLLVLLALGMSSCDFDIDPDPVVEENTGILETPEERRANEGLVLRAKKNVFAKGTRTKDTHKLTMEGLGVTIMEADEIGNTGSASLVYQVNREVEVMSPSIWKIAMGDAGTTLTMKLRGEDASEVQETKNPFSQEVVIRDGDQFRMEGLPSAEQKEALSSFDAVWFGGDAMFADKPMRRRASWAIKPEVVLEAVMGRTFTEGSGSAHLFVQQTLDFDGEESAEVVVSIERCRGLSTDENGDTMQVELHGHGTLQRSLEPLHTTQVNLEGTVRLTMKQGEKTMKFAGPFECRARSEVTLP